MRNNERVMCRHISNADLKQVHGGGGEEGDYLSSTQRGVVRRASEMSSHDPRLLNSMGHGNVSVQSPNGFKAFYEMMSAIRRKESMYSSSTLLLYHYTSPNVASLILKGGLRMSTQGQGDGGVYFSLKGPASYGYGLDVTRPTPTTTTATTNNANSIPSSLSTSTSDKNSGETSAMDYESRLIIDCYGKERLHEYYGKNMLSLVLVCAIEEGILTKAPGGRDNALVREKHMRKIEKINKSLFLNYNFDKNFILLLSLA
jgi:hypothetical protein